MKESNREDSRDVINHIVESIDYYEYIPQLTTILDLSKQDRELFRRVHICTPDEFDELDEQIRAMLKQRFYKFFKIVG